jgi:adenosylhomocysteine nucleosidase
MSEQWLVILTAVRMEAKAVARGLGVRAGSLWDAGCPARRFGFPISAQVIGIGAKGLPPGLTTNAGCVILAGFAGALDPALKVGDVVLDWRGGPAPQPGSFRTGRIHSANAIVATAADKAALFARTGAAAVEMEGDAVRRLLAETGIPFIGLRAITDAADEELDPALLGLVDSFGRPKPLALAGFIARHPRRIASLRRLGAAVRLAGRRLSEAISVLVRSDELKRLLESRRADN